MKELCKTADLGKAVLQFKVEVDTSLMSKDSVCETRLTNQMPITVPSAQHNINLLYKEADVVLVARAGSDSRAEVR